MATTLEYTPSTGTPGTIVLDLLTTLSPDFSVDVPEHPVETGTPVSDTVIRKLVMVQLEGMLFDFPLRGSGYSGRARESFNRLRDLMLQGATFTVATNGNRYESLLLVSLREVLDKPRVGAVQFVASFKERIEVESQFSAVTVTTGIIRTNSQKNNGKQDPREAKSEEKLKSWFVQADELSGLSDKVKGLLDGGRP